MNGLQGRGGSSQELSLAHRTFERSMLIDDLSTGQRQARGSPQADALIGGVVYGVMQVNVLDRLRIFGPDDKIRVGANGDRAFSRMQSVCLAGLVEVSSTKRLMDSLPSSTP